MGEKVKVPNISDTVLIDGVYRCEQRSGQDRRRNKRKYQFYERRFTRDPRAGSGTKINEEV
ncbi:hypothetical protein VPR01S_02_02660 [Vibrio proteolyticus NBRC 13287]|uniref:Uncharacterized protein n=1 Tax=Vibrio proteolyticus NBRC 13287 TaxID=1219065 RepID=U2ZX56_VIBPR|nr:MULTISPECIES: hypothetical protein [Vibrio]GAD66015.1 hypothetical protein VPR01S_02_02660 [Vibrio proteolyticus NBRC 13287]